MSVPLSPATRAEFDEHTRRQLAARGRLGITVLFTFLGLFTAVDYLFNPGGFDSRGLRILAGLRGLQAILSVFAFLAMGRATTLAETRVVAAAFTIAFNLVVSLSGIPIHDIVLAPTVLMSTNMFCAALVPWGAGTQAVVAGMSVLSVVINVLGVSSDPVAVFGYNQIEAYGLLAASVWIAVVSERQRLSLFLSEKERALAHEAQSREARVADALARVGEAMIESSGSSRLVARLCAVTAEVLGCELALAYLWNPETATLSVVAAHGGTPDEGEKALVLRFSAEQIAVLANRLVSEDVVEVEPGSLPDVVGPSLARVMKQAGITRAVFIALRRGDVLIGALQAGDRRASAPFAEEQHRIAAGISHLASMTMEHARVRDELETANRVRAHFVATLSHELRNPIGAIQGYSFVLLDGLSDPLTPGQRQIVEKVDRCAHELQELIHATLDLSRFEAKRVPLDLRHVSLSSVFEELRDEVPSSAAVVVEWRAAADLPEIETDPLKLKMILRNLVNNAFKFTESGSITITAEPIDGVIELRVADTGMGIPRSEIPQLFEAFTQAHGIESRKRGGAGLGLHLVQRLVDLLGGSVEVESEVGRGTVFRVRLPRVHPTTTAAESDTMRRRKPRSSQPPV